MKTLWKQVVELQPIRSLQARATLLVIAIVAGVLALSTFLGIQVSERALEQTFQEKAVALARQFAAGISSWEELQNVERLKEEIRQVMEARPSVVGIEVFSMIQGMPTFIASSQENAEASPGPEVFKAAQEDQPVTVLRKEGRVRQWEITAPVHLQGAVVGVVHLQISGERGEWLAARLRRQALLLMGASTGVIVLLMSLFLRWTLHRPIQRLATTMARAEAGDLAAEASIQTQDELGQLALSFNQMLRRIRNFNSELREKVERATAELRELNEKLFKTRREMGRLERLAAVGEMAAMVAHDVGTPLTSISGHLQLLAEEVQDPHARDRLGVIQTHIARAVAIMREFLDSSRFPLPARRPIQVNTVVQEVLALASPAINQQGIQVVRELSTGIPEIFADGDQLRQVLLNLVTNALDAMPEGGQLSLVTRPVYTDGGLTAVQVQIVDTGLGIPTEDLWRIFDPFFTTKSPEQGTGLGLTICQRIVKAHKGLIEVKSEKGKGATFTITLPVGG